MDPQDLLYTNEFLNTAVIRDKDLIENTKYYDRFTDYISKKTVNETQNYLNDDEKESSIVNIDKNLYTKWPIYNNKNHYPLFDTYINDISSNRYKKKILTKINVDSRNRDLSNFLYPYQFSLTLPYTFENITKIFANNIIFPNINQTFNNNNNALAWQYASKNYLVQNGIDNTIIPLPLKRGRTIAYSTLPNSVFNYKTLNSDVNYVEGVDNYLVYQTFIAPGNYTIDQLIYAIRQSTTRIIHGKNTKANNIEIVEEPYLVNKQRIGTPHLFSTEINQINNQVRFVNRMEELPIAAIQTFSQYEINFRDNDVFYSFSSIKTNYDLDTKLIYITLHANDITEQFFNNINCFYSPNPFPLVITNLNNNLGNIFYETFNYTIFYDLSIYLNHGYNELDLDSICYYKYIDTIILDNNKLNILNSKSVYLRFGLHLSNGMINGSTHNPNGKTILPIITENLIYSSVINNFFMNLDDYIYPYQIKTTTDEETKVINSTSGLFKEYKYFDIPPIIGRALLMRWIFDLDNKNYVNYQYRTVNVKKRSLLNLLAWPIGNVTNNIIVKLYNGGFNFVLTNYQSDILNNTPLNPFSVLSQTYSSFPVTALPLVFFNNQYYFSNSSYVYIKLTGNSALGQYNPQLFNAYSLNSLQYDQNYILSTLFNVGIGEDYTYLQDCSSLQVYNKSSDGLWAKILLSPIAGNTDIITNNIVNNSNDFTFYTGLLNNLNEINIEILDSNFEILTTTQNFSFTLNIETDLNVLKETNIDTQTNNVNSTSHYI